MLKATSHAAHKPLELAPEGCSLASIGPVGPKGLAEPNQSIKISQPPQVDLIASWVKRLGESFDVILVPTAPSPPCAVCYQNDGQENGDGRIPFRASNLTLSSELHKILDHLSGQATTNWVG